MEPNSKGHYDLPRSWKRSAVIIWLLFVTPATFYFGGLSFTIFSWGLLPLVLGFLMAFTVVIAEGAKKIPRTSFPMGGYMIYVAVQNSSFTSQVHPVPTSPPRSRLA